MYVIISKIYKFAGENMAVCSICGAKLGFFEGTGDGLCSNCSIALQKERAEKKRQEQEKEQLRKSQEKEKIGKIIVTTSDIYTPYEILTPIYFQVSNNGVFSSQLGDLINEYEDDFKEMQQSGQMGEIRSVMGILFAHPENKFEAAFYVALMEMKKVAYNLGADAVICMRHDIDLGSQGYGFFHLQMYGTAVKFTETQTKDSYKNTNTESLITLLQKVIELQKNQLQILEELKIRNFTASRIQPTEKQVTTSAKKTKPFSEGDIIKHAALGKGEIMKIDYQNKCCYVQFEKAPKPVKVAFDVFKNGQITRID